MTNSKATKKALFMSMLSLLLCFTMLMGATFAWFTDTVTSKNNRIVAGNLKVDLVMDKPDADGNYDGNYESIKNGNGDIFSEETGNGINWEPGKTEIVYLGVKNLGSLALKYNIILNIIDEGLIGSLEYAIIAGAKAAHLANINDWEAVKGAAIATGDTKATGDLPKGQVVAAENGVLDEIIKANNPLTIADADREVQYFALAVHMKEEATNEYQNKGVQIDVTVVATQVEAEEDSFDNTYDAEADFETASVEDLENAIAEGGTIKLVNDMIIADGETLEIPAGTAVVIDLNGKTITGSNAKGSGATITNNGTLTIKGGELSSTATNGDAVISNSGTLTLEDVTINGAPIDDSGYPAYAVVSTGELTINDGTNITSDRGAINIEGGNAVINGGSFVVTDVASSERTSAITLHTVKAEGDVTINGGTFENSYTGASGSSVICPWGGDITINGGTFRDAVDDASNHNNTANFQNYMGMGGAINVRGGTYDDNTVVKNLAIGYAATEDNGIWTVGPKAIEDTEELTNVINAGETDITLADGNFTMPEPDLRGKKLTISGTKDTVIDVSAVDARDQFVTGATLEFDGVTLNFGKVNYMGFANTASLTYKNCEINGLQFLYGDNVTFENCVFNSNGAEHSVWTYGAKNVSFTGCDFTYGDRAINVYLDNGAGSVAVSFEQCKFITENTASKGAVEINSSAFPQGANVSFNNCTTPAYGTMVGISGWDSANGANAKVTIDGAVTPVTQWAK